MKLLIIIHPMDIEKEANSLVDEYIDKLISDDYYITTYECEDLDATNSTEVAIFDFINDGIADAEFIYIECRPNEEMRKQLEELLSNDMKFFKNLEEYREYIKNME